MAQDPGRPFGAKSRKTLDDIRREINAEFALPLDDEPSRGREVDDFELLEELRSGPNWRGYLKVAALATIVVGVFGLGYVIGRRGSDGRFVSFGSIAPHVESTPSMAPADATSVSSPPVESAPSATASEPASLVRNVPERAPAENPRQVSPPQDATPSAPAPTERQDVASRESRTAVPDAPRGPVLDVAPRDSRGAVSDAAPREPRSGLPDVPSRESRGAVPDVPSRESRGAVPDVTTRESRSGVAPVPGRVEKAPASVGLVLRGPGDWVESQWQLRTALREWLRRPEAGAPGVNPDDAEVILGADGHTAKTRVLVRVGRQTVMREQRWGRTSGGWMILEDRQVEPPRP